MATPSTHRTLVIALGTALGAALLVIAFLLGRESGRQAEVPATANPPMRADADELTSSAAPSEREARRWPAWADLEEWQDEEPAVPTTATQAGNVRLEERPDGTLVLSNRTPIPTPPSATPTPAAGAPGHEITDYFIQMDVIRSQSGAGDPNAFAMDLIKAAMGGSTAGFDQLIDDTSRMEAAARQVTPPPDCEAFHQENLAALAESREVLSDMKAALERGDIGELTTIARRAGSLQARAQALQETRKRIVENAGY